MKTAMEICGYLRQGIEELSGNKLLKKNPYHRDNYAACDNSVT
jgi:hypothetical protein